MAKLAPSVGSDRLVASRAALAVAFIWGLAEATVFFIVPDVLLTLLACRALGAALKGTVAALGGALIGGAAMYVFGRYAAEPARLLLDQVPAISATLIAAVESQIAERGLASVMLGPLKGIPYKIYAVEWGARGGSLLGFLLVSIPARYARFLLSALAVNVIASLLKPWTRGRAWVELSLLAIFWVAFYSFYFARFGW